MSYQRPPWSPSQASSTSGLTDDPPAHPLPRENTIHLTPHAVGNHPYSQHAGLDDPRTSSVQSLKPTEAPGPDRRTLLIIYIHGFMGDETSFRSFPAHVHSLLSMTLVETHVVYTKIYPRYQSRKNISFARDAFSNWLVPHESNHTDVILVGHSLGGILGAEVVLTPSHTPGSNDAFQHRILGLVAFDTPFLGMHPGVIGTGIASLFQSASDQPDNASASQIPAMWTPLDTTSTDPNFNPAYSNDVNHPIRKNKWERAWYFWNKHCGELRKATQSYVKSHLEFGGCLADYPGLKRRYDAIRLLEDIDELEKPTDEEGKYLQRVRFVNYYTASTGRIKEQTPLLQDGLLTTETEMQTLRPLSGDGLSQVSSHSNTPGVSLQDHHDDDIVNKTDDLPTDENDVISDMLQVVEPRPHGNSEAETDTFAATMTDDLPAIPEEPTPPYEIDLRQITDPEDLKSAEKENGRSVKKYEKAQKERQKAIKDREKIVAKRERDQQKSIAKEEHDAKKQQDKAAKTAKKEEERLQKERLKRQSTLNPEQQDKQMGDDAGGASPKTEKKKKDRKFCTLPSKDQYGQRDPTWIRVYMEGMDEVVAHTSLFFISDAYAKLVGDTADRIERWLTEDATRRILLMEQIVHDE